MQAVGRHQLSKLTAELEKIGIAYDSENGISPPQNPRQKMQLGVLATVWGTGLHDLIKEAQRHAETVVPPRFYTPGTARPWKAPKKQFRHHKRTVNKLLALENLSVQIQKGIIMGKQGTDWVTTVDKDSVLTSLTDQRQKDLLSSIPALTEGIKTEIKVAKKDQSRAREQLWSCRRKQWAESIHGRMVTGRKKLYKMLFDGDSGGRLDSIQTGNIISTDPAAVITKVHNHFSEIFAKHQTRDNHFLDSIPTDSKPYDSPPITRTQLHSQMRRMAYNKAPGPDGIQLETIKALPTEIKDLTYMVFSIVYHSEIPTSWRHSETVPIHKGKDLPTSQLDSFRPISLADTILKLYTGTIHQSLGACIRGV